MRFKKNLKHDIMKELKETKITADQQIEVCNNAIEMSEKVKWNLR